MIFSPRCPDLPLTLSPVQSPVILDRAFSEIETLGNCQWRRFGADLTCCDLRFALFRRSMLCCCGGRSVSSEFLRLLYNVDPSYTPARVSFEISNSPNRISNSLKKQKSLGH
ncbi:hypothetical protein RHMOL_Rhmol03G0018400 [Rhododendron molle]|uniref:Uncharacterized protein n=1 Tax=Rhododendron molle TaxID=49168 RepID=A0ACC0PBT8_RHOML|nr:hypothetical protein RHMOL_Rhmol03G0018400 [Rhododendron molle]